MWLPASHIGICYPLCVCVCGGRGDDYIIEVHMYICLQCRYMYTEQLIISVAHVHINAYSREPENSIMHHCLDL